MSKAELNKTEVKDERVFTLTRPFKFDDQEYTELLLDFDKLSGNDMISIEREMKARKGLIQPGEFIPMMELNKPYQAFVAARAAGVVPDLILALPAKEFSRITARVFGFLMASDSEETEEPAKAPLQ